MLVEMALLSSSLTIGLIEIPPNALPNTSDEDREEKYLEAIAAPSMVRIRQLTLIGPFDDSSAVALSVSFSAVILSDPFPLFLILPSRLLELSCPVW